MIYRQKDPDSVSLLVIATLNAAEIIDYSGILRETLEAYN
jgi:hypothetical protein